MPAKTTASFRGGQKQFLLPNFARTQWSQSDRCFDSGSKLLKEFSVKGYLPWCHFSNLWIYSKHVYEGKNMPFISTVCSSKRHIKRYAKYTWSSRCNWQYSQQFITAPLKCFQNSQRAWLCYFLFNHYSIHKHLELDMLRKFWQSCLHSFMWYLWISTGFI